MDVYSPSESKGTDGTPLLVWWHLGAVLCGSVPAMSRTKLTRPDGDRKTQLPRWLFESCRDQGWTVISADYRLCPESNVKEVLSDVTDCWDL